MGMPKGRTGNPNGRPKGTPNKKTEDLRAIITAFVEKNMGQVQELFDQLEPKEKLAFLKDISQYSLPKLAAVDSTVKTFVEQPLFAIEANDK